MANNPAHFRVYQGKLRNAEWSPKIHFLSPNVRKLSVIFAKSYFVAQKYSAKFWKVSLRYFWKYFNTVAMAAELSRIAAAAATPCCWW